MRFKGMISLISMIMVFCFLLTACETNEAEVVETQKKEPFEITITPNDDDTSDTTSNDSDVDKEDREVPIIKREPTSSDDSTTSNPGDENIRAEAKKLKLTEAALERAIVDEGNTARLAKVLKKAANKEKIVIGTIGGSITQGTAAESKNECYASYFYNWFCSAYPNTPVELYNVGKGATTSLMGAHRVEGDLLDKDPDLVIVDFSVNDTAGSQTHKESYESLIRQILSDDKAPAVIALYMMNKSGNNTMDIHQPIVKHYGLTGISYKAALWPDGGKKIYEWNDISPDDIHPNSKGHAIVGELLIYYIESVRAKLDTLSTEVSTIPAALTANRFANAQLLNGFNTTPVSNGSFTTNAYSYQFPGGWSTTGGGQALVIEVENVKNIYLLWLSKISGTGGTATVKVDGQLVATINSNKYITWGDCAQELKLLESDTPGDHIIEIQVTSASPKDDFDVLGLMVS